MPLDWNEKLNHAIKYSSNGKNNASRYSCRPFINILEPDESEHDPHKASC